MREGFRVWGTWPSKARYLSLERGDTHTTVLAWIKWSLFSLTNVIMSSVAELLREMFHITYINGTVTSLVTPCDQNHISPSSV